MKIALDISGGLTSEQFVTKARNFIKSTSQYQMFVESRNNASKMEGSQIKSCDETGEDVCLDFYIGGAAQPGIQIRDGEKVYVRKFPELSSSTQVKVVKNLLSRKGLLKVFLDTLKSAPSIFQETNLNISNLFEEPIEAEKEKPIIANLLNAEESMVTGMPKCKKGSRRGVDGRCHKNKSTSKKRKSSKKSSSKRKSSKRSSKKRCKSGSRRGKDGRCHRK